MGYPGHSTEELRSALLAGHWVGASRVYVENLDYDNINKKEHHHDAHDMKGSLVFFEGPKKYRLTPYGEVFKWYTKNYRTQNPVPYTWRDARCKVAIVRFPDSCWGARGGWFRDRLLGSKIESSTPATEAWFSIWNQLTLGTIPKTGLSFHSKGAAGKLGPRFFCPVPPTLVFDHRVGNEHPDFDFRGAKILFLTGTEITRETFKAVNRHLQKTGAKAVLLKSLVPDGFKPNSRWIIVDSFDDPKVQKLLKPVLPPNDEMQYIFGDHKVVFKKINRDRIQVFLNGKPASPIIKSNSKTSLSKKGTELLKCEKCQENNIPKEVDWKKDFMTIAKIKRDADGNLLPLQSYDETIRRGMSFLLDDHLKWFKGPPEILVDENGKTQMPWVYFSNLQHNGSPFPNSVDKFVSYPALHHALMIRLLADYAKYANDDRGIVEAVKLADWNIAQSTPADWPYGNLPYSTFQEKKPGGFRDKTGLMPDKAAIMALAYLYLHEATSEARFLKAAEAIARTLKSRQRANGTWPFRVDPKTEKVIEDYTSSVIYAIMLFEKLDKLSKNNRYKTCRDKTWNWLLNGPIKTKEFRGFYEDIPESKDGRTNIDCLDTIRYLLANRTDSNGYLKMAEELNAWIEKIFLDKIKGFEPAEGIREQLQCNVVMGIHSLNWASMLLDLSKANGDKKLRQRAIQTANYVTYYLQPDNRIVVGFEYNQWWYSCHMGVINHLFDFVEDQK